MTRLELIYTDILWSFLAELAWSLKSKSSQLEYHNLCTKVKAQEETVIWYILIPKDPNSRSNLRFWFGCNYILYTFARSLNLISTFCPPILGDEQHFGAVSELHKLRYDRVWQSMCLILSHVMPRLLAMLVRIARLSMKIYGWGTRPAWAILQLDEHLLTVWHNAVKSDVNICGIDWSRIKDIKGL